MTASLPGTARRHAPPAAPPTRTTAANWCNSCQIRPSTGCRHPLGASYCPHCDRQPTLAGNRAPLAQALAAKRATIAQLEAAWVAAAEADTARNLSHGVRIDDRAGWDRVTWQRYLNAATDHEPEFKPRIMRLLREIESIEALLAMPAPPSSTPEPVVPHAA